MKCCVSCGNYVIKIVAAVGSLACYFLLFGFWKSFETRYHRFVVCTILPGYLVLYISFTLAVLCGKQVDRRLNRVFAMFGVGAYWGAAAACWLHLTLEKKETGKVYCMAAGAGAAFQVLILTIDAMFLLKDRQPKAVETSEPKTEHLKLQEFEPSVPSTGGTPFNSAVGPKAPAKPGNIKHTV